MTRRCDGCHRCWSKKVQAGPMLRDATWLKLADKHETLCGDCVLQRATERRINLTFADLKPCPFNLWGSPSYPSWFDRLGGDEATGGRAR